jgi:hypothetical protein
MNFFKKMFLMEGENPATRKQKAYRNLAKRRGLLSFNDISQALKDGEEIRGQKISLESVTIESLTILEASKNQSKLDLKDVTLFSPNNLNNHYIGSEELKKMVEKFNKDGAEKVHDLLNINHSQNIEDALGSFSNIRYDEEANLIKGDVSVERFNNSKLQDMLSALNESKDLQLGLSIEFTAEDYEIVDSQWGFSETTLVGLALTLTPSAPQTLTSLESVKQNAEKVIKEESNTSTITVESLQTEISDMLKSYTEQITALETNQDELLELVKKQTETIKKQSTSLKSFDSLIKNSNSKNII